MNKLEKKEVVDKLKEKIGNSNFVLSGFKGLTVSDIEGMRNKLRTLSYSSNVAKNRILLIALKELGITGFDEYLKDTTILTIQKDTNSFEGFKVLSDFAKTNDKFFIKGGFVEGKVINSIDVDKIASLPSREVLISRLLAQMNAPISKLVYALNNPISKFVYALDAIKNKKN